MKISEALSPARDLQVRFEAAILNVTYRPAAYTIEEIERLEETEGEAKTPEQRRARLERLLDTIGRIVISWDLTDDSEVMISPTDRETLRHTVPMPVFMEIIKAVREDQKVGEAEGPSDAS